MKDTFNTTVEVATIRIVTEVLEETIEDELVVCYDEKKEGKKTQTKTMLENL